MNMEIKIENVKAAFNTADESGKKLLLALFPELSSETAQKADNRPVTERIKTFEDAARAMGINDPEAWEDNYSNLEPDILAYFKLRIICAALNEGWEPQFTEDEWRYYPWFWLYTQDEIDNMDEDEKKERHFRFSPLLKERHARRLCGETVHKPLGRLLLNQKIKITSKFSEYGDKSKYHGHQTERPQ